MASTSDIEKPLVPKDKKKEVEEDAEPVKSQFKAKFSLAISMAFWVTFFYIPVIVPSAHQAFFVDLDLPNVLGSPDFESYWPNTVQLIVFTVYYSTGTTVSLAWQGIAGTALAGMNQAIMGKIFPVGGKCLKMGEYTGNGIRGFCEEYADPNYAANQWFVWLDVFLFIFLLLSLNTQENMIKYGLAWHMVYMMAFMSPTGYVHSHAVNITTVFGVTLAIIITLVPQKKKGGGLELKHMVSNNLESHPLSIAKKVGQISSATVGFMLREKPQTLDERYHYKVDKVAISQKIDGLSAISGSISSDYATSWWEGWLFGLTGGAGAMAEFRAARTHCGIFAKAFEDDIGGFDDVTFIMKKVVVAADAGALVDPTELAEASAERQTVGAKLMGLNTAGQDLLEEISSRKEDGETVESFELRVKAMIDDVNAKFFDMLETYRSWTAQNSVAHKSRARQVMRTNMNICVFSVMQLAKEVMDLADKVIEKYKASPDGKEAIVEKAVAGFKEDVVNFLVTDGKPAFVQAMLNPDKRSFVLRNLLSIGICFLMGNFLQGNVFNAPFNAGLAGTLAVLISHFPGSAFYKNLMRLLGLAIGNALPVVLMATISLCGSWKAEAHLLIFFLFTLYFGLMYLTSPEWGTIGCLVTGFGCYSFTTETWSETTFSAGYCKIGQVTAAVTVQIVVDIIDTTVRKKFPQDIVVENLQVMLEGFVEIFEKFKAHMSSPTPDPALISSIKESAGKLKGIMASQEAMVAECESKTTMIAGPSPAFKLDLYKGTLASLQDLLGEIDALCLVDEFSEKLGNEQREWFDVEYTAFYTDVVQAMKQTFETLMLIFTKKDEGLIPKDRVKVALLTSDATKYTESLRMATVKRIIADTLAQVLKIEQLCCESGTLEFGL